MKNENQTASAQTKAASSERWYVRTRRNGETYIVDGVAQHIAESYFERFAPTLAAAPEMLHTLENGVVVSQAVLDAWEKGDLALAVRCLDSWKEHALRAIASAKGQP